MWKKNRLQSQTGGNSNNNIKTRLKLLNNKQRNKLKCLEKDPFNQYKIELIFALSSMLVPKYNFSGVFSARYSIIPNLKIWI